MNHHESHTVCFYNPPFPSCPVQEMRTTEVRALLPDAWGFVCPVHTPDGAPCGLLNHLAFPVEIVTHAQDASQVPAVLVALGE